MAKLTLGEGNSSKIAAVPSFRESCTFADRSLSARTVKPCSGVYDRKAMTRLPVCVVWINRPSEREDRTPIAARRAVIGSRKLVSPGKDLADPVLYVDLQARIRTKR